MVGYDDTPWSWAVALLLSASASTLASLPLCGPVMVPLTVSKLATTMGIVNVSSILMASWKTSTANSSNFWWGTFTTAVTLTYCLATVTTSG